MVKISTTTISSKILSKYYLPKNQHQNPSLNLWHINFKETKDADRYNGMNYRLPNLTSLNNINLSSQNLELKIFAPAHCQCGCGSKEARRTDLQNEVLTANISRIKKD